MPRILDRLPIPTADDAVIVRGEQVRVKAHEIIAWVSLQARGTLAWDSATPRFPVILDTAHTHNFSIQEEHLIRWAGMRPEMFRILGTIRQAGQRIPLHAADVWVHRNRPGERDRFQDVMPYQLILPRGIAIYPPGAGFPRLPLLGIRALLSNRLYLGVDGQHREASLRTLHWFASLLRRLRLPPF